MPVDCLVGNASEIQPGVALGVQLECISRFWELIARNGAWLE